MSKMNTVGSFCLVCMVFALSGSASGADRIECTSIYFSIGGGAPSETNPGPALAAEVDESGSAFNRIVDQDAHLAYSVSLAGGKGAIGLTLNDGANAIQILGDLSEDSKSLSLTQASRVLSGQVGIQIECARRVTH